MLSFLFKGQNKLDLDKKGFDNLTNKEQGEQQKKEEEENQDQGKPKTVEEMTSCEHQDQRERLEKESQSEAEESKERDGILVTYWYLLQKKVSVQLRVLRFWGHTELVFL